MYVRVYAWLIPMRGSGSSTYRSNELWSLYLIINHSPCDFGSNHFQITFVVVFGLIAVNITLLLFMLRYFFILDDERRRLNFGRYNRRQILLSL